jgi:hypothetical protein
MFYFQWIGSVELYENIMKLGGAVTTISILKLN